MTNFNMYIDPDMIEIDISGTALARVINILANVLTKRVLKIVLR